MAPSTTPWAPAASMLPLRDAAVSPAAAGTNTAFVQIGLPVPRCHAFDHAGRAGVLRLLYLSAFRNHAGQQAVVALVGPLAVKAHQRCPRFRVRPLTLSRIECCLWRRIALEALSYFFTGDPGSSLRSCTSCNTAWATNTLGPRRYSNARCAGGRYRPGRVPTVSTQVLIAVHHPDEPCPEHLQFQDVRFSGELEQGILVPRKTLRMTPAPRATL